MAPLRGRRGTPQALPACPWLRRQNRSLWLHAVLVFPRLCPFCLTFYMNLHPTVDTLETGTMGASGAVPLSLECTSMI
jgi:hypothetical protein